MDQASQMLSNVDVANESVDASEGARRATGEAPEAWRAEQIIEANQKLCDLLGLPPAEEPLR